MDHPVHISDKPDVSPLVRIATIVAILAMIGAGGAYLVYGSGLWNPAVQHTAP